MNGKNRIYLGHILDSIAIVFGYLRGAAKSEFDKDIKLQDAVIRRVEIIGEAAKNISDDFKEENSDIPWHRVIGMRNLMVHEYFGVDNDIVWDVCRKELPILKGVIENILKKSA